MTCKWAHKNKILFFFCRQLYTAHRMSFRWPLLAVHNRADLVDSFGNASTRLCCRGDGIGISFYVMPICYQSCHVWKMFACNLWMMTSSDATFTALLAICAGKSPVPAEFPAQRPVTRSFNIFLDLRLNKRLSKQSWGWWFETLSHPLWRHCHEKPNLVYFTISLTVVWHTKLLIYIIS